MRLRGLSSAVLLVFSVGTGTQTSTGVIAGQTVDAATGRPVAGALVQLIRAPGALGGPPTGEALPLDRSRAFDVTSLMADARQTIADEQGRFAFTRLPLGTFSLAATKPGWSGGGYLQQRPDGAPMPVVLTSEGRSRNGTLRLWKNGVIGGMVIDEAGEPIVGVTARAVLRIWRAGRPRYVPAAVVFTDDRGLYRLSTLRPGEYAVAVAQPPETMPAKRAYRTTFYPGVAAATQATTIVLGSGQERSGIDFQLRPIPVVQVSGTVAGADAPLTLRLVPSGSDELAELDSASATTAADGHFAFPAVPAGQYMLRVLRVPSPALPVAASPRADFSMIQNGQGNWTMLTNGLMPRAAEAVDNPVLWASSPLSVGGRDITDLAITLRPGYRMSGRAEFDGAAARPSADQLRRLPIMIERADASGMATSPVAGLDPIWPVRMDDNGTFLTPSLVPGRYFIRAPFSLSGWTLKSAMLAGRDLADVAIDIQDSDVSGIVLRFTDRVSELTGVVEDQDRRGGLNASVVIFPAQSSRWVDFGSTPRRLRVTSVDAEGRYRLPGLPPGEYLAAAVRGDIANDWQNPEYLKHLSWTATKLTIGDGEKRALDLSLR